MTAVDAAIKLLARPARLAPGGMLIVAGALGRSRERVHPNDRRRELAKVYSTGSRRSRTRVAGDLAANDARTLVFEEIVRRYGWRRVERLIRWDEQAPLGEMRRDGGIVAFWHCGPAATALGPAFSQAGLEALLLVHAGEPEPIPGIEFVAAWDHPRHAVDMAGARLERGGLVMIAIDARVGRSTPPVEAGGVSMRFRRGAFLLARRFGSPVYPLAVRWCRFLPVVTVVVGSARYAGAGQEDDVDVVLVQSLADWLQEFLHSAPESLRVGFSSTS